MELKKIKQRNQRIRYSLLAIFLSFVVACVIGIFFDGNSKFISTQDGSVGSAFFSFILIFIILSIILLFFIWRNKPEKPLN